MQKIVLLCHTAIIPLRFRMSSHGHTHVHRCMQARVAQYGANYLFCQGSQTNTSTSARTVTLYVNFGSSLQGTTLCAGVEYKQVNKHRCTYGRMLCLPSFATAAPRCCGGLRKNEDLCDIRSDIQICVVVSAPWFIQ